MMRNMINHLLNEIKSNQIIFLQIKFILLFICLYILIYLLIYTLAHYAIKLVKIFTILFLILRFNFILVKLNSIKISSVLNRRPK